MSIINFFFIGVFWFDSIAFHDFSPKESKLDRMSWIRTCNSVHRINLCPVILDDVSMRN